MEWGDEMLEPLAKTLSPRLALFDEHPEVRSSRTVEAWLGEF